MEFAFTSVTFAAIESDVRRHLLTLPSSIDSFLEDHILASKHYRITVAGESAGFASIHEERLITQFAIFDGYRQFGQMVFGQLRKLEQVQAAFVPTSDEFYLAHALDVYRQLAKQAYFFATASGSSPQPADGMALRLAEPSHLELVRETAGDFFHQIERHIDRHELYVTTRGDEPVGFGLLIRSALYDDTASIGMFTIESFRQTGVGSTTIALLIEECRRLGLRAVAGCWYYNHQSKKTLERAGMYSGTRLLKVEY